MSTSVERAAEPMLIYICSPFRAGNQAVQDRNVECARRMCLLAMQRGHVPVAPHLMYPGVLDDRIQAQRRMGLDTALSLLERCDEVWALRVAPTEGMRAELEHAVNCRIPVCSVTETELIPPPPPPDPRIVQCQACQTHLHRRFTVILSDGALVCRRCANKHSQEVQSK